MPEYFTTHRVGDVLVIRLAENVDAMNFAWAARDISNLLSDEPAHRVVLNLARMDYIQSAAIGHLLKIKQQVDYHHGRMCLCAVQPRARQVLEVSRLTNVFHLVDTEQDALDVWVNETVRDDKPGGLAQLDRVMQQINEQATVDASILTAKQMSAQRQAWGRLTWVTPVGTRRWPIAGSRSLLRANDRLPFHRHPNNDELLIALSGQVTIWLERVSQTLSAGDTAFIPKGRVHALFNNSDEDFDFLSVYTPHVDEAGWIVDVSDEDPWKSIAHAVGVRDFELERLPGGIVLAKCKTSAIFDQFSIDQFLSGLTRIIAQESPDRLILDFTKVGQISSGALGALAKARGMMKRPDGLVVCGLQPRVQEVFSVTAMNRLIPVFATADDACQPTAG